MRGTFGGKAGSSMDARTRVNQAVQPPYRTSGTISHTLQKRDRKRSDAQRLLLFETVVEAIAGGSDPRLAPSRNWP